MILVVSFKVYTEWHVIDTARTVRKKKVQNKSPGTGCPPINAFFVYHRKCRI